MKMPKKPPVFDKILHQVMGDEKKLILIFKEGLATETEGKYWHWDFLRHRPPPTGLTHQEWWFGVKLCRKGKELPFFDKNNKPFSYTTPDTIADQLHKIDFNMGGIIGMPDPITNPQIRNQYIVRSLVREAITSSQLEGAAVTRDVAKEMIRTGRPPKDKGEQMILNNYHTMQQIREWKQEPLSQELVFKIHRMVTEKTLDKTDGGGRFRREDETVVVQNDEGDIFHYPPLASELPNRMKAMCSFANDEMPSYFIHPVLRAIMLHFWLAYDHPFVDGNGRTARALFYWSMLRHGYWLFEFISISDVLLKAPIKYALSFLFTETDDNDLTYFIIHQIKVISKAIRNLHKYIELKSQTLSSTEDSLKKSTDLNFRQKALLLHALRHPSTTYTVEGHQNSHNVVYETARKDLLNLKDQGFLDVKKHGKAFVFIVPTDISRRITKK